MKMEDVFHMPMKSTTGLVLDCAGEAVFLCYGSDKAHLGIVSEAAAHAINLHDELVHSLRDTLAGVEFLNSILLTVKSGDFSQGALQETITDHLEQAYFKRAKIILAQAEEDGR